MIDWTKPLQRKSDGKPATLIYATHPSEVEIRVVLVDDRTGPWMGVYGLTPDGRLPCDATYPFENVPETVEVALRIHVYRSDSGMLLFKLSRLDSAVGYGVSQKLSGPEGSEFAQAIGQIDVRQTILLHPGEVFPAVAL
jgi:hypothetical protein